MLDLELLRVEPTTRSGEAISWPATLQVSFEGFEPEAFAILNRLRQNPHIEQYRAEKESIRRYLTEPFKRYRDDLVLNWVLPNRLAFETEKNVFSRLLKNDFGAGGCHHHLWMAFYRPGRRRLTDVQLSHSIDPEGFTVGLYIGDYATELLSQAKGRIEAAPDTFMRQLNTAISHDFRFVYYVGSGAGQVRRAFDAPLEEIPEDIPKATGLWLRTCFSRTDVLAWKGDLLRHTLGALRILWPVYVFLAPAHPPMAANYG